MEPEIHQKPIRYYEIDLLRFCAALSVVVYHYTYRGYVANNYSPLAFPLLTPFTKYGYLGVELFFIISGYVVLLSAQGKTVRQFFISRVTRLYPAFWVACTLTFLVKIIWVNAAAGLHPIPAEWHASPLQYVTNMTMLYEFLHVEMMDGAYWSLTIEITFYFIIAILIGFKLLRYLPIIILVWLGYTALPGVVREGVLFPSLFFPAYAPFFIAGMLLYLMQQPQGRTWQRYALLLVSYALALRASIGRAGGLSLLYHDHISGKVAALVVTACYLMMILIAFRKIDFSRFKWLSWLGALTYPLYLLHGDIALIAFNWLGGLINKYVLVAGALIMMLVASYLIHIYVEKRYSKILAQKLRQMLAHV